MYEQCKNCVKRISQRAGREKGAARALLKIGQRGYNERNRLTVSVKKDDCMNQSYFKLPKYKQDKLINAGYKVFSTFPYKKASMAAIAEEGCISKSLLFYYFKNKKEYYLYLFSTALQFLNEHLTIDLHGERADLFDLVDQTIETRMKLLHSYPYIFRFVASAYYEKEQEILPEIEQRKELMMKLGKKELVKMISLDQLQNPDAADDLINIILNLAEGCMRGREDLDIEKIQEMIPEYQKMMASLKAHYYKNQGTEGQKR